MKKIVAFVSCLAVMLVVGMGVANAKSSFKKDLGAENCATCHIKDKKAPNPDNKLWKAAKDMIAKSKEGKGEFAGNKSCNDCHKGKMKPAK